MDPKYIVYCSELGYYFENPLTSLISLPQHSQRLQKGMRLIFQMESGMTGVRILFR